jgi:hypothetical protein
VGGNGETGIHVQLLNHGNEGRAVSAVRLIPNLTLLTTGVYCPALATRLTTKDSERVARQYAFPGTEVPCPCPPNPD